MGTLSVALLIMIAAPLPAVPPPITGDWVVRAGAVPLMLIHVGRETNGDAGTVTRPRAMSVGNGQAFDGVEGPAITQRIATANAVGNGWELTLTPRRANEQPTILTMGLGPGGEALLGWKGAPIDEVPLEPASAGTTLPGSWDKGRIYYVDVERPANPEMAAMFNADQADRAPGAGGIDWDKVAPRDEARRLRTKTLLNAGKLSSGDDYFHAAFIFQHGGDPQSYLLAHVLASTAVARGRRDAAWIAAATLDRYLQSIGQKQIYGTQYATPHGGAPTQEPYDRALISDALRKIVGVGTKAEQEKRRVEMSR